MLDKIVISTNTGGLLISLIKIYETSNSEWIKKESRAKTEKPTSKDFVLGFLLLPDSTTELLY